MVGVPILIAILIVLAALVTAGFLSLSETQTPAPSTRLVLQYEDTACQYSIRHRGGDALEASRLTVRGVSGTPMTNQTLTAGESVPVSPTSDEVRIIWQAPDTDDSYPLATLAAPSETGESLCLGEHVFTEKSVDIGGIGGVNGSKALLPTPGTVEALGPATVDLTDDGKTDIPYVNDSGVLKLTNTSNETAELATGADISGDIAKSKTRLATGTWNGSSPAVFFVDATHDKIYRVTDTGAVAEVADPSDGAQAVVGVGDIDGDGEAELVFADGSQYLRYLEQNGSIRKIDDGQLGSNNGIGAGPLVDFDDDGVARVVSIDGSNNVKIAGESVSDGGEGTTVLTAPDAKKSPPTVVDINSDGTREIIYIGKDNGHIKYIEDFDDSVTIHTVTNASGAAIDGSAETGLT